VDFEGTVNVKDSGDMRGVFQQPFLVAKQARTHFLLITSRWDNRSAPGEDFGARRQMRQSGPQQCAG